MVGGRKGLVQFNDVRVLDVFDDEDLFFNALSLLLAHGLDFDHFYGKPLKLALLPSLVNIAGGSRAYFPNELVVTYFF